jgi:hypothetical protein
MKVLPVFCGFLLGTSLSVMADGNTLPAPSTNSPVINVLDYGVRPDDGINDLPGLRKAVAAAIKQNNATLLLPPGVYDISDSKAVELQNEAMDGKLGNPEPKIFNRHYNYVTALDFTGADHLTIEARGAELRVDGWMEPVSLQQCTNVTIHGLTIDYKRPPNSEGRITAVGDGTVDVQFEPWCPVNERTPFLRMMVFDDASASFLGGVGARGQQLIAPQTLRFQMRSALCQPGRVLVGWHGFHFRPAILLYQAENITLDQVTIHSQPGMGIVGHLTQNITCNGLKVIPRAGRHTSSNTDATHFVSCRGLIRFDGCEFAGQGDDSINVHCFYTDILSKSDNHCVLAISTRFETHSVKRDIPRVGDTLALIRRDTLEETGSIRVKSVTLSTNDWSYTVEFEGRLPEDFQNYLTANITASPALEFVNCHVRSHRARAVLVKTRKVRIEGCTLENVTGTAIHIGAEGNWMEGVTSADVIIRNNTIAHSGFGEGTIDGASAIAIHVDAAKTGIPGLHKRILIENNRITGGERAIAIKSAEDVTVRNNTFKEIHGPAIDVGASSRVWAHDNDGAEKIELGEKPALPIL